MNENIKSPFLRIVMFCFMTIFALGALVFCFLVITSYFRCEATKNWPTVQGIVITSVITEPVYERQKPQLKLSYQYAVDGKEFTGDAIYHSKLGGAGELDPEMQHLYKPGSTVPVHYNPDNHHEALLLPGFNEKALLIAPVVVLTILGAFVWDLFDKRSNKRATTLQIDAPIPVMDELTEIQPETLTFEIPKMVMIRDMVILFIPTALFLFIGILALLQTFWGLSNQMNFNISLLTSLMIGGLICWLRFRSKLFKIELADDTVSLHTHKGVQLIATEDIKALIGLSGVNLDGGEIIIWKTNLALVDRRLVKIKTGQISSEVFDQISQRISGAVLLPYKRSPFLPEKFSAEAGYQLTNVFNKEALKHLLFALSSIGGAVLAAYLFVKNVKGYESGMEYAVACVFIAFFVGVFQLVEFVRSVKTLFKVKKLGEQR